jgi:hypothetical protein
MVLPTVWDLYLEEPPKRLTELEAPEFPVFARVRGELQGALDSLEDEERMA